MQIKTQPIKEAIEIKSSGIAFDVYGNGAKRIGDLAITKNGLIWSNGNVQRAKGAAKGGVKASAKGVTVKWDDFISWMQSRTQTRAASQIQTATRSAAPSRTAAPKAKAAAAKPRNAIDAKKPAAKISASAKTARKKAH